MWSEHFRHANEPVCRPDSFLREPLKGESQSATGFEITVENRTPLRIYTNRLTPIPLQVHP
jgi:hypothetical protein